MLCPKCNGEMWDNRGKKTNPKAPDFKCKDKENCDGVIWPPKGAAAAKSPSNGKTYERKADQPTPMDRDDARHYMMRAANLLQLAHNAASCVLGKDYTGEDARTLFIQAAREGYVAQMPDKPVSAPEQAKTIFNATESQPELKPGPDEDRPF